jgi:LacI family transcriptional regulator
VQNIALISSIDNLVLVRNRWISGIRNNGIAINSSIIIRTDAEEDLGKIEKYSRIK